MQSPLGETRNPLGKEANPGEAMPQSLRCPLRSSKPAKQLAGPATPAVAGSLMCCLAFGPCHLKLAAGLAHGEQDPAPRRLVVCWPRVTGRPRPKQAKGRNRPAGEAGPGSELGSSVRLLMLLSRSVLLVRVWGSYPSQARGVPCIRQLVVGGCTAVPPRERMSCPAGATWGGRGPPKCRPSVRPWQARPADGEPASARANLPGSSRHQLTPPLSPHL